MSDHAKNEVMLIRVANWSQVEIEPVSDTPYNILCVYMSVVTCLALVANGLFIAATFRSQKLRQPLHYMLRNLAVADLCSALVGGPTNIAASAAKRFYMGQTMCKVEGFLVGTFGIVNLTSISLLSFSRYLVICQPFGIYIPTKQHARSAVVFAWAWALAWNLPPLIWDGYDLEGIGTNCGPVWNTENPSIRSYLISYMVFCFFGIVFTLTISYTKIIVFLRKSRQASTARSSKSERTEKEITKIVINIMCAFLVCWTPYAVVAIIAVANPGAKLNQYIGTIPVYFAKSSTVYNPCIYILMNRKIRKEMIRVLHKSYRENEESTDQSPMSQQSALCERNLP